MVFYQIFCANCGFLFIPSEEQRFLDRSATITCCSKNCLKIHNFKYSAWVTKRKIDFQTPKDAIIATIKIIGNIPEITEILKLVDSLSGKKFTDTELLKEIIVLVKDNVIPI